MSISELTTAVVKPCVQKVRMGEFTKLYRDRELFGRLRQICHDDRDHLGAQSAALVSEILDQLGFYKEAGELANADIGEKQLLELKREISRSSPSRDVVRAYAWHVLQCGVNAFRRQDGAKSALSLLDEGLDLITGKRGKAIESQHIRSLFHFWRGRIRSTALYEFREADVDFERALSIADTTLEEKLSEADAEQNLEKREELRSRHLAANSYVLSTILGFGLAHSRQLESRLFDSIWFLRAAVPLSRVNHDVHRRGFAHLLMGTALRGVARLIPSESRERNDSGDPDLAERELREAERLLADTEPHGLHLARVYHQLALSYYNRAALRNGSASAREQLQEAERFNRLAAENSEKYQRIGFGDTLLTYGIKVVSSLIRTAQGDGADGVDLARDAMSTLTHSSPRGAQGWALVAHGIALAEKAKNASDSLDKQEAERVLKQVAEDVTLRQADRAAAHLHLARLYSAGGQPLRASQHYELAVPLVKSSEHGWILDLQTIVEGSIASEVSTNFQIDIKQALTEAARRGEKPMDYISSFLEVGIKRRLLSMPEHQTMLRKPNGDEKVAQALGVTRATLFNWRNHTELKPYFPPRDKD